MLPHFLDAPADLGLAELWHDAIQGRGIASPSAFIRAIFHAGFDSDTASVDALRVATTALASETLTIEQKRQIVCTHGSLRHVDEGNAVAQYQQRSTRLLEPPTQEQIDTAAALLAAEIARATAPHAPSLRYGFSHDERIRMI